MSSILAWLDHLPRLTSPLNPTMLLHTILDRRTTFSISMSSLYTVTTVFNKNMKVIINDCKLISLFTLLLIIIYNFR